MSAELLSHSKHMPMPSRRITFALAVLWIAAGIGTPAIGLQRPPDGLRVPPADDVVRRVLTANAKTPDITSADALFKFRVRRPRTDPATCEFQGTLHLERHRQVVSIDRQTFGLTCWIVNRFMIGWLFEGREPVQSFLSRFDFSVLGTKIVDARPFYLVQGKARDPKTRPGSLIGWVDYDRGLVTDGTLEYDWGTINTEQSYAQIEGAIRFAYGHDAIVAAIGRNLSAEKKDWEALSWRFVRDPKGWRVLATVSVPAGTRRSVDNIGVVGVDLNAGHLAVTDVDRFGNPVASFRVPCTTRDKAHHQALAAIGDAVSQVVTYACLRQKPIVAERIDFQEKKAELESCGARYSHMLSGFAYAAFHAILSARTYDAGVAVYQVNPAYTSVIGRHNFADRYGLSRHQAAACAIGRRAMQLAERPNHRLGDHVAFPLPVRNRGKHVWALWREVPRREAAPRARGRPGPRARSSPAPIPGSRRGTARRVIRSSAAGGIPARESSAALFG